jgi:thiol-disulfide isomerase/thioredoxin
MEEDYFTNTSVINLTQDDFDANNVANLTNYKCAIVLFYKPSCPYCKEIRDTWVKVGNIAAFINVAAFDASKNHSHMDLISQDVKQLVKSFPTIIGYKDGKPDIKYNGDRSYGSLLKFAQDMRCKKY